MIESQFLRRKKLWRIAYGTVPYAKYPVAREKLKKNGHISLRIVHIGTSLSVQWFRVHAPNERDMGSIPGQRRFCMPSGTAPLHTHTHK